MAGARYVLTPRRYTFFTWRWAHLNLSVLPFPAAPSLRSIFIHLIKTSHHFLLLANSSTRHHLYIPWCSQLHIITVHAFLNDLFPRPATTSSPHKMASSNGNSDSMTRVNNTTLSCHEQASISNQETMPHRFRANRTIPLNNNGQHSPMVLQPLWILSQQNLRNNFSTNEQVSPLVLRPRRFGRPTGLSSIPSRQNEDVRRGPLVQLSTPPTREAAKMSHHRNDMRLVALHTNRDRKYPGNHLPVPANTFKNPDSQKAGRRRDGGGTETGDGIKTRRGKQENIRRRTYRDGPSVC